jgi:anaerobic ribonucleoside-triphosphate reductase
MEQIQRTRCEVWGRVVGFLRPRSQMNEGKVAEFNDRTLFNSN